MRCYWSFGVLINGQQTGRI